MARHSTTSLKSTLRHALLELGFIICLPTAVSAGEISFNRQILPILSDKCFHCHGPDSSHREADLRLDLREEAIKDAIVPGKSADSEALVRILSKDPDEVMPPPKSHLTLTQQEKALLRQWIDEGAEYQPHWSFIAPSPVVAVPAVSDTTWPRNNIDRFVLARLDAEKMKPSSEATRERWLRRVTFDLTGLPPTQPEIDAFLADTSPDAYVKVADRLLASPRFGERMAVPWLDIARYADSFGYQADIEMQTWPWRDWVIKVMNENLPWDQFITQQLAGDLLPDATQDQKLATAFNRLHRKTNEGGSIPEEMRQDGISDRVHTVGTAFLGLTFECARCHDHKYDPILAKDYYSLAAFFNSIDEHGMIQGGENRGLTLPQPALMLPTPEQKEAMERTTVAVAKVGEEVAGIPALHEADFQTWLDSKRERVDADLVAHFTFEEIKDGQIPNAADKPEHPVTETQASADSGNPVSAEPAPPEKSKTPVKTARVGSNKLGPGKLGQGMHCTGDDAIAIQDFGIEKCHDPLTFSFWLKPGENYPRSVVIANTTSFDANFCGYELLLEKGRLRWTLMREFPGSAISIQSEGTLPVGEWSHVVVTYDGSSKAAGMRIDLNGKPATTNIVSDNLSRDFRSSGTISFGARGRDFGLRNGAVDDIRIYKRAITPVESGQIFDGSSLSDLLAKPSFTPEETSSLREYYFSAIHPQAREGAKKLLVARTAWREVIDGVREISVMKESAEPRPAHVLLRGAYDQPGEEVERETPAFLPPFPTDAPRNRLGYAKWLTMPDHPLTSRVLVNRLWQEFFGRGIVVTSDNFGLQGAQPTHPELLDWLARDFINSGWDHKRMCREIVLSSTYRQDSRVDAAQREKDPDNSLLARGPSRRLTAEMLRDSALALGGILQPQIGGPPVKPYQAEGSMWKTLNNFLPVYEVDKGPGVHRRSIYTFWRRTTTPPNMIVFDSATRDTCSARRQSTNTPLQPLVLLNDPQFVEAARALGERMLKEGGVTDEERVKWAFREVIGRPAYPKEIPVLLELYRGQRESFTADPEGATKLLAIGQIKPDPAFANIEAAAAATVASALFNLDASITLR
jgi:hypothetical protein